jgi:hypothetical protein
MTEVSPYDGLTEDELAAHTESSQQLSSEDASTWAARTAREDAAIRAKAEARRAEATADTPSDETAGPSSPESSETSDGTPESGPTE